MGYRSNVVIAVKRKVLAEDLIDPRIPGVIKELPQKTSEQYDAIFFFVEDWKWYSSYPDIQAIEEWFSEMNEEDFGAIRIGEDDNDVQSWGTPWTFEMNVHREICTPFS